MSLSILLQKSSGIALFILCGLLAYQFALFSWSFFPVAEQQYQWQPPKIKTTNTKIDTQKVQQQHLFGEVIRVKSVAKPTKKISVAPKTKLNVILVGVVAASEPEYSSAIISYKNKQGSYFIDSEIEGTSAAVSEIYGDRVILDVDGSLQTLMLDGLDNNSVRNNTRSAEPVNNPNVRTVKVPVDRQAILKNPSKLTDYIRISPYRKDGEILGYRLKAGKDKTLFEQAGFEQGDLATELNGVDLTDSTQAFSLMKELPTMTEISVTVERDGQVYELFLNIP